MLTDYQFVNLIMDACAINGDGLRDVIIAVIRGDEPLQTLRTLLWRYTDNSTASCILSFLNTSVDI